MKKLFISCSVLSALLMPALSHAQNIYGTFETWRNYQAGGTALEAPQNWYGLDSTFDGIAALLGSTPQKQVVKSTTANSGTYAASIVTKFYGGALDTIPGSLINAKPVVNIATQDFTFTNYTTVSSRVNSMSAWIKYVPAKPNDAGSIEIDLIKSGIGAGGTDSIVGDGYLTVRAMANFTNLTIPVSYVNPSIVPDKVMITFLSSGDSSAIAVGSTMTIDDVVLNLPSGVEMPVFGQTPVQCFPNPCTGIVNFTFTGTNRLTAEAYDVNGRQVGKQAFKSTGRLDLQSQPTGNYFYKITDDQHQVIQNGKILIQR